MRAALLLALALSLPGQAAPLVEAEARRSPEALLPLAEPAELAYWFGWFAFFPQTEVYGGAPR